MKHLKLFVLAAALLLTGACTPENEGPELIIDPVEKMASISVVNVSGKTLPSQIQIDGLYGNKSSLGIGSGSQEAPYEEIASGLRNVTLGDYKDTIRLQEHNYYTLMVYDNDSLRLSLDAPYGSTNQFVTMPQVRWNMIGSESSNYKVDINADSLLRDISMDQFISVAPSNSKVKLNLYHRDDLNNLLGEKEVDVETNKKVTVNIRYNAATQKYDFTPIMQSVK